TSDQSASDQGDAANSGDSESSEGDEGDNSASDNAPGENASGENASSDNQAASDQEQSGEQQPAASGGGLVDTGTAVARPAGAVVVPDKFLRRWDPITFFFDQDTGPANGGPEDPPEKYQTTQPAHAGAATWLNARTLQFRPAEPWPPLTKYTLTIGKNVTTLATLMSAPSTTLPKNGAADLDPVKSIALTLAEPLD